MQREMLREERRRHGETGRDRETQSEMLRQRRDRERWGETIRDLV